MRFPASQKMLFGNLTYRTARVAVSEKDKRMLIAFGNRLAACRKVAGYEDAKQAATDLGIKAPAYRKYERGEAIPPVPILLRICDLYETTSDFLLFGRMTKARTQAAPAD